MEGSGLINKGMIIMILMIMSNLYQKEIFVIRYYCKYVMTLM